MRRRSDERGIALILAVFALVVIAALISAVFFTAQLEERSGSNTMASLQASEAAQAGLEWAAANWSESWAQAGVGKTTAVGWSQLGATPGYFTDSITELNTQMVLVRAFGQSRNAAGNVVASRSAGMLFKTAPPDFNLSAALTASGSVTLVGTPVISGVDAAPPGGKWSTLCGGYPLSNVQAIRNDGSYTIAGTVTPSYTQNDTSATTSAAKMAAAFYTLSGMADISTTDYSPSLAPVLKTGGHQCYTGSGHPDNWGDPTAVAPGDGTYPCTTYFPLIYYHGCCAISIYDPGQGVLLVDRTDLSLWGSFYGLILVHSGQVTVHSGATVYGMIVGDAGSRIRGTVKYSSCAVKLATAGIKLGQPLTSRASIRY